MRDLLSFLLILVLAALFNMLALYWADTGIRNFVTPSASWESLTEWTKFYSWWAIGVVNGSCLMALLWFARTWSQRDAHWKSFNRRKLWAILWIAASLIGFLCSWPALSLDRGRVWVILPNVVLASSLYYLTTVLFSPSTFAHTPYLARRIRLW